MFISSMILSASFIDGGTIVNHIVHKMIVEHGTVQN